MSSGERLLVVQASIGVVVEQNPGTSADALVKRGQNRFNIYCTPCHGYDGKGNGAIPQRVAAEGGNWAARNLVDASNPVAMKMPNGQLFNTISNGYNTMQGYAAQIPTAHTVLDRDIALVGLAIDFFRAVFHVDLG